MTCNRANLYLRMNILFTNLVESSHQVIQVEHFQQAWLNVISKSPFYLYKLQKVLPRLDNVYSNVSLTMILQMHKYFVKSSQIYQVQMNANSRRRIGIGGQSENHTIVLITRSERLLALLIFDSSCVSHKSKVHSHFSTTFC